MSSRGAREKVGDKCLKCGTVVSVESPFQLRRHPDLRQGNIAECPTSPPSVNWWYSDDYVILPLYMVWLEHQLREDDLVV